MPYENSFEWYALIIISMHTGAQSVSTPTVLHSGEDFCRGSFSIFLYRMNDHRRSKIVGGRWDGKSHPNQHC